MPTYLRPSNKGRMLWGVIGQNSKRAELFSGKAWFDSTLESTATEELAKKVEAREVVKKMTVSPHSDDGWEQLAELYLDEMDDAQ